MTRVGNAVGPAPARPAGPGRWGGSGSLIGDRVRRDVFYFRSGSDDLYGSVYAPPAGSPSVGVVVCGSWGFEGNRGSRIAHRVSYGLALAGGVGFCFHYPGFGDSYGDFAAATLGRLADAAVDATAEASRRYPGTTWVLVGPMLGASIASLATARGAEVEHLALLQPALRPTKYFARLERASRRSIGRPAPAEGFAFGYRLSPALLDSATTADVDVGEALRRFPGKGTVVRYEAPAEVEGVPERFDHVGVPGSWRFGMDTPELIRATSRWLRKDSGLLARRQAP